MHRAKKTHCLRGHPRIPENLDKFGTCKVCKHMRDTSSEVKRHRRAYRDSPEGKAYAKNYQGTLEDRTSRQAYRDSAKGKSSMRRGYLKLQGWTIEMFNQTLLEQGNVCALCREPFNETDTACADHAHTNPPEPRGILHRSCNLAIGFFRDNPDKCRAAVEYLEAWGVELPH